MNFRIGHGYDVHRLVEGRDLILGGVNIPWKKGLLGHSDADVLAQAPKLSPHKMQMRENLAAAAGLDVSQISVKATTEEGLGWTGSGEGMAVHALALLTKK